MKDNKTTEYFETLGNIGLSSDAKKRMRDELSSYADFHTVRIAEDVRSIEQVQNNSVFTLFTNSKLRIMKATLLIALMVGMGGTSLASQNAVPGDLLYPVKVHVNENVRSAFAVGADAQAQLQLDLLTERLEEAKELAVEGRLKGETAVAVQSNIAAQVDKTVSAAAEADAKVGAEIKVAVSTALKSFSNRLATVPQNGEARMNMDMEMSHSMAAKSGSDEASVMTMSAFGTGLAADISTGNIVEHAQARLEALQAVVNTTVALSAQVKADIKAQLTAASEFVAQAQAQLTSGAQAQAEASAQQAHEIMGEIESALSLLGAIKIDPNTGFIIDLDVSGSGNAGGGTSGNSGGSVNVDSQSSVQSSGALPVTDGAMDIQAETQAVLEATGNLGL